MKTKVFMVFAMLILVVAISGCAGTGASTGSSGSSSEISKKGRLMPSASEIGAGYSADGVNIEEDDPDGPSLCPYSESETFQLGSSATSYTIEIYKCKSAENAKQMIQARRETYYDYEQLSGYGDDAWIKFNGEDKTTGKLFYRTIIRKGIYFSEVEGHSITKEDIIRVTGVVAGNLNK